MGCYPNGGAGVHLLTGIGLGRIEPMPLYRDRVEICPPAHATEVSDERFVPALGYDLLTAFYDPVVKLTTREKSFKTALVGQCRPRPGQKVLDLACGSGTLAILMKLTSPDAEITGIDGDPKIVRIARDKAKRAGLDIRFDTGMSDALPYRDESFDRVVSSLFFHHLTRNKKLQALKETKRVLKSYGELHIADWGLPANGLMRFASRIIRTLDGSETTGDNFRGLLPKLMIEGGFEAVEETDHYNTIVGTMRLFRSFKGG